MWASRIPVRRIRSPTLVKRTPRFDDFDHSRVLVVECLPSKSPVFVKDGQTERFYMRTGAATAELTGGQAQDFIKQRFGN